jgi:hypothetical protein
MMAAIVLNRRLARHGVLWNAQKGSAGHTTDRWQDKGARGVLGVGRVYSEGYGANSHSVRHKRGLRHFRFPISFNYLARCAEHML